MTDAIICGDRVTAEDLIRGYILVFQDNIRDEHEVFSLSAM